MKPFMGTMNSATQNKMSSIVRQTMFTLLIFASAQSTARAFGSVSGQAPVPSWFTLDVQRKAAWLPSGVRSEGWVAAYRRRWASLPADVQVILTAMRIPEWQIALIPYDGDRRAEIAKQFRFMSDLAGAPPASALGQRLEQLLVFGGAAQLPTPGDNRSGASLGAEGCTAAMAKYVLAQLKLEFTNELAQMSRQLALTQSSLEMKKLFGEAAAGGSVPIVVTRHPFASLKSADIEPGSLMIAQKPGGTHVFGWTRVPRGWNWSPGDKMAVGNTGLSQFGNRMILAQEYVTDSPALPGELEHNRHGPINGAKVRYVNGAPDLADSSTNVYAVEHSSFILINFR